MNSAPEGLILKTPEVLSGFVTLQSIAPPRARRQRGPAPRMWARGTRAGAGLAPPARGVLAAQRRADRAIRQALRRRSPVLAAPFARVYAARAGARHAGER